MAEREKRSSLVREAALNRIASQERLDVLNDVTRPWNRIWLGATGVALVGTILWSIFGSLPVNVTGEGILIQGGEVRAVTSPDPGMIENVIVTPGQMVEAGKPVARLSRSQVIRDRDRCRTEYEVSKSEEESVIQGLARQLTALQRRENDVAILVKRGRLARRELDDIQGQITAVKAGINAGNQKIRALFANCERLEAMAQTDAVILSVTTGRVIEVTVRPGDTVTAGAQLLTVEPTGNLEAVIFIPARDVKLVREGMPALLSPAHIRPEEDGYLMARVKSVATYPATPEALNKVVRNQGLAQRLLAQGLVYQIDLGFEKGEGSRNEFRWTGKGSKVPIESGTLARASVAIERRRPASYVLPILRKAVGAG